MQVLAALSRLGLCSILIGILLVPRIASSNVVYDYAQSSCYSFLLPGACTGQGYWMLSDTALDDGVATGTSEILGFNFTVTHYYTGSTWSLSHLNSGPVSDIRLYGDGQRLTQFDPISIAFSRGEGRDINSLYVRSTSTLAYIYLGPDYLDIHTEGEWIAHTTTVPLPASLWLFLSGLGGLRLLACRRRSGGDSSLR